MNQKTKCPQRRSAARDSSRPTKLNQRRTSAKTAAQILDLLCCPPAEACCHANTVFLKGTPRSRGSAPEMKPNRFGGPSSAGR